MASHFQPQIPQVFLKAAARQRPRADSCTGRTEDLADRVDTKAEKRAELSSGQVSMQIAT
jgi:hypothetical protein